MRSIPTAVGEGTIETVRVSSKGMHRLFCDTGSGTSGRQTAYWHVEPFDVSRVRSTFFRRPNRFPEGSTEFDHCLLMRNTPHERHWVADYPVARGAASVSPEELFDWSKMNPVYVISRAKDSAIGFDGRASCRSTNDIWEGEPTIDQLKGTFRTAKVYALARSW